MRKFFPRLSETTLIISLLKSMFGCVTYLGNVLGQGKVKPGDTKIDAISRFAGQTTMKYVMCFLEMAGYYRKFCQNFFAETEPLTQLLRKNTLLVWTEQQSFEKLKTMLQSAPVLSALDFDRPSKIAVEKEGLAITLTLTHFEVYVSSTMEPTVIPKPAARSATLGVSPRRGLLILRCESHSPFFVGLVWFGRSTF